MTEPIKKRPVGLIQNNKVEPIQTAENTKTSVNKETEQAEKRSKKKGTAKNQEANIKVSNQTKNEIDILMKLTDNKFAYEMVESLIDHYVDNVLDSDKKRAFKTLSSL